MPAERYHSSRPTESVLPRPQSGYTRGYIHGPLIGLYDDTRIARIAEALRRWSFRLTAFAIGFTAAIGLYHVVRYVGSLNLWFAL